MADCERKTPEITTTVPTLPGMQPGCTGVVGQDKPGANVRIIAIPAWRFIAEEVVLYSYVNSWIGVATLDGVGALDMVSANSVLSHLWHISVYALAPTAIALMRELWSYLQRRRQAAGFSA